MVVSFSPLVMHDLRISSMRPQLFDDAHITRGKVVVGFRDVDTSGFVEFGKRPLPCLVAAHASFHRRTSTLLVRLVLRRLGHVSDVFSGDQRRFNGSRHGLLLNRRLCWLNRSDR